MTRRLLEIGIGSVIDGVAKSAKTKKKDKKGGASAATAKKKKGGDTVAKPAKKPDDDPRDKPVFVPPELSALPMRKSRKRPAGR